MRIFNAIENCLQEIPFALGEKGRQRWLEEVKVSNRPGQEPSGPEDVGYVIFGKERKHCILTKTNPKQKGILLRINTRGAYTRGSCGKIALKGGNAKLLVAGRWAAGHAGSLGNGPDELWHIEGPSVFDVIISGGEYKGFGHHYLIVTRRFEVVVIKEHELCQLITVDERPDVTDVVRQYIDEFSEDVKDSLATADKLDSLEAMPEASEARHFVSKWDGDIASWIRNFEIAIPASMADEIPGVSGIESGTLIPGDKSLVALRIGPGGGRRYGYEIIQQEGTKVIARKEHDRTAESILATIQSENWKVAWIEYKDGDPTAHCLADAGGIHRRWPGGEFLDSEEWDGVEVAVPSLEEFERNFFK